MRRSILTRVTQRHQWPPPRNHLDGRVCPDCRGTAHGNHGQHHHEVWHDELEQQFGRLQDMIADLYERIGQAAEYARREGDWAEVRWSAAEQGQPVDMSPVHALEDGAE